MSATTNQVFFGDQSNFEAVVPRYSPVLFRIAFRRLRNTEDAVQDALLSAHKCIGQFHGRSKLSSWLTSFVTNTPLMKLRRHSRYEMLSVGENPENDSATFASKLLDARPSPEAIYAPTGEKEILPRALGELPPNLRTSIQLCDLDGIPIREAANALGISFNAIKSRVARARASLKVICGEVITTGQAIETATCAKRTGTVYREPRSPLHREAFTADAVLIEQSSSVCISSFVPVSNDNEIIKHTEMRVERKEIHIPPRSLEMATHHNPPSYAT